MDITLATLPGMKAFFVRSVKFDSYQLACILEALTGSVNVHTSANRYIIIEPLSPALYVSLRPKMLKIGFKEMDYFST